MPPKRAFDSTSSTSNPLPVPDTAQSARPRFISLRSSSMSSRSRAASISSPSTTPNPVIIPARPPKKKRRVTNPDSETLFDGSEVSSAGITISSDNCPSPGEENSNPGTHGALAPLDRMTTESVIPKPEPLSSYSCPICFSPPTNATLTPCGHICCGECLFTAVRTTTQRAYAHMLPDPPVPRCPICRAVLKGWDGKGGGVIGLKTRAVFSL